MMTRIMKGIYNSRPPKPKYTSTWDVNKVVTYLAELGPNDSLSLKDITIKLAMLMALVQASRSSELAALDLKFRAYRPEGVSFTLPTVAPAFRVDKCYFGYFCVFWSISPNYRCWKAET